MIEIISFGIKNVTPLVTVYIFNNLWIKLIAFLNQFIEHFCIITFDVKFLHHIWIKHFGNKNWISFRIRIKKLS